VVIEPLIDLPTSADCSITLTDKVRDKNDDAPFEEFSADFSTEVLAAVGTDADDLVVVPAEDAEIVVSFNSTLQAASVAGNIQIRQMGTTTPLTATLETSGSDVTITVPAGTLTDETTYEVVIAPAVADSYGQQIGGTEPQIVEFTTAPPETM
jgi:hypothetical protein